MRSFFWLCLVSLPLWADTLSGQGRQTLVDEPWGTIYCAEGVSLQGEPTNGRWRLDTPQGPVSLLRTGSGYLIQAANQNLRLEIRPVADGDKIVVNFNGENFRILRAQDRLSWESKPQEGLPGIDFDNEVVGIYLRNPLGKSRSLPELAHRIDSLVPFPARQAKSAVPSFMAKPEPSAEIPSDPLSLRRKPFDKSQTLEEAASQKASNGWGYPDGSPDFPKDPLQPAAPTPGQDPMNLKGKPPFTKSKTIFEAQQEQKR
jgi:hypothetical protein